MMIAGVWIEFVRKCFSDLRLIGKILFLPIAVFGSVVSLGFCIGELVLLDIWVVLIALCSKDATMRDLWDFWFG